ncbi:uncharacterized protein LOC127567392 [Pristis pectinata]|uniref:uncharacterized protein LOC127567392 n=1 Tax=Pristis pectinata TaxID=685728 RepID=UPI00223E37BD|nr:uncharacterized protein LOC127567392 [Pristis pectinata]XP_051866227.1 uncharacterized protein LOC127567392 [Pristis pectinata]XP_051866237.1 uncharacterized protein LOC127567392 [Pristis pectinata]XP_051866245.1 uncharacterized protein LOC127567392 [Pristis pectinata]
MIYTLWSTTLRQDTLRPSSLLQATSTRPTSRMCCQSTTSMSRGPNILDHCYTTIKDAFRATPHPHFGKSDQQSVLLLLPAYKQKLKREDPVQRVVQCWSEEIDELLCDCFESVDWSMFKDSAASLDEYISTITEFISKYIEDCVPKRTIRVFPNRKPWMNWKIHTLPKSRTAAFKSDAAWPAEFLQHHSVFHLDSSICSPSFLSRILAHFRVQVIRKNFLVIASKSK